MSETSNDLLKAADRSPEIVERRKSRAANWMPWNDRRRKSRTDVGLEISSLGISMAYMTKDDSGQTKVMTDFRPFPNDKRLWTVESLAEPLHELVNTHRLQGQTVFVALGSEACVTRTLSGTNDDVDSGYKELLERSNHFLALGQGNRVHCHSELNLDAKRKRAWVTIAQHSIIEAVSQAIEQVRLRLGKIEHSTVALCQVIGHAGLDASQPVLLVLTNSHVASLVLSYNGQLILDYRPASATHETCQIDHWCESIRKHQKCLQRYLSSQLPRQHDKLDTLCLPGSNWSPLGMVAKKVQALGLKLEGMPIARVDSQLDVQEAYPSAEMLAAIWMARSVSANTADNSPTADLYKSFRPDIQLSTGLLLKAFWPMAAALLLVACMYAEVTRQNWVLHRAEATQEQQSALRLELQRLDQENSGHKDLLAKAAVLKAKLKPPTADHALKLLGRTLAQGMWLRQVSILPNGQVQISGTSYSNEGIYEYLAALKATGTLHNATLLSTRSVRFDAGDAFEFELSGVWAIPESNSDKAPTLALTQL